MPSETPPAGIPSTPPPRGLPPVTPPSGKFIAQLFLVPGMIVLFAVLLLLMFRYLFGGSYAPEQFLRQLDDANPDIRWRGASDLAQVLEKNESLPLRADVAFAQQLARRLQLAIDDLNAEEKALSEASAHKPSEERDKAWRKLAPLRKNVNFLAAAVSRFHAPVALPPLAELAQRSGSPDAKGEALLRRQAVWALGILGNDIQNFAKLPAEHRSAIVARLIEDATNDDAPSAVRARTALFYLAPERLEQLPDGKQSIVAVDGVLARCAEVDDPFTRELVALALRFWDGPLVEPTVVKLTRDDGHGQLLRSTELD